MGIAGSGKWTLIKNLQALERDDFSFVLSYKSRQIRPNEVNGVDSHFITRAEFFDSIEKGEFLEYALVHNLDYYGTKFRDVYDDGILKGKKVITEIDIHGLKKMQVERPDFDVHYSTIFLNIPQSMLKERIEKRGVFMSDEEFENRMKSAIFEEEEIQKICTYTIDATQSPQKVVEDFLKIVSHS